jgi:hypothetical protein
VKPLSRRLFLRGALFGVGTTVALPALVSLLPRAARASVTPPKRFVFFFHPNGVDSPSFWPSGTESAFTLGSNMSESLEPWRDHMLWLGGLNMQVAVNGPGEQHQRGMGALLTGQGLNTGPFVGNDGSSAGWAKGISLDQALVPIIGQSTPVASLQLGVNVRVRNNSGVVSYMGDNAPLLPENDPRQTYRTLFFTDAPARASELPIHVLRRKSVLDSVAEQLKYMRGRVSTSDARRLDEHLTLVRDLEKRLAALASPTTQTTAPDSPSETTSGESTGTSEPSTSGIRNYEGCSASGEPVLTDDPESVDAMPEMAHLQLELAALALRCDLTRIVTVCFADAQNHISMPFLGVSSDIHNLSHLSDNDAMRSGLRARDKWQGEQFAGMMQRLQAAQEADGSTALDNSLLLWGTEVSKGNTHSHSDMPFMVGGRALGWRTDRYVRFANQQHNDLLLTILRGFGGTATSFGDPMYSSGELTGIA